MAETKPRDKEKTIAYRLGRQYSAQLEAAATDCGISPGQYARMVLRWHFEETQLRELTREVGRLHRELEELRLERLVGREQSGTVE